MKHNLLKSVILSVILLMGVSNAWAYVTYYLKSDNTTWDTNNNGWGFTHNSTTTTYMANGSNFKLWRTDWGSDGWFGVDNGKLKPGDGGLQFLQYKGNVQYNGPSGMVCFNMDQSNNRENSPWVWITRPTFYLKHNWGGGSWTWKALTDNQDGTYQLTDYYGGTTLNYGDNNDNNSNGWASVTATKTGTLNSGNKCIFTFNSADKKINITRLYTIKYDGNGSTTGVPSDHDKKHGTSTTLSSSTPTRTGYTFAGWNTKADGSGTNYAKGASYSANADVTLYAKWTAHTYTVKFNANGGTGTMASQSFTYGVEQKLTANSFTRTGYSFNSWNTNTGGTGTKYTNQQSVQDLTSTNNGTVNLYAQWTENKYNVIISTEENGTTNQTGTKSVGIVGISITATPNTGYVFKQWNVTGGAKVANPTSASTTVTATADGTVTAVFEETTFVVRGGVKFGDTWTKDTHVMTKKNASEKIVYYTITLDGTNNINNESNSQFQFKIYDPKNGKWYGLTAAGDQYWYTRSMGQLNLDGNGKNIEIRADVKGDYEIKVDYSDPISSPKITVTYPQKSYYLSGSWDDWKGEYPIENTSVTIHLEKGEHSFLIFDYQAGAKYYGNIGKMERTNCSGWPMTDGAGNCRIDADITGDYTFTFDASTKKLTVLYPMLVTLGSSKFGPYGIKYNGQSYFSKETEDVVIGIPKGATINFIEGQPYSDLYTGDIMIKNVKRNLPLNDPYIIEGTVRFDANYVTKVAQVAYLGVPNNDCDWDKTTTAANANFIWRFDSYSHFPMTNSNDKAEFAFEEDGVKYYKFTIPAGCNEFQIQRKQARDDDNNNQNHTFSHTCDHEYMVLNTGINCYMLDNGTFGENTHTGHWCALPADGGDYRLLYVEQVVEKDANGNTVVTRKKAHPSDVVRASELDAEGTIVSLHIYKDRKYQANLGGGGTYESSSNPEIILQKYHGNDQWEDEECHMVFGPLKTLPSMGMLPGRKNASVGSDKDDFVYDNGIDIIKNDTLTHKYKGSGVWNFYIIKNETKVTLDLNRTHRYEGQYYIRTDAALGGWNSYTSSDNHMTRSDISMDHSNYSHYFCKWISNAETNLKYTIANDYGMAISDTLEADSTDIWGTPITVAQRMVGDDQLLPKSANVRFSWNEKTNFQHRAYLAGSGEIGNRFLVVEGEDSKILNADGQPLVAAEYNKENPRSNLLENEEIFNDISNWVYYADVQLDPNAGLKVTANYNEKVQYFVGQEDQYNNTILTGTGTQKYLIRLLYDFKSNHLLSAYIPGGNTNIEAIETNLMLIRKENDEPRQLSFNTNDMSDVGKQAYGVLELTQETLEDTNKNIYVRSLYWISFPFDVRITDIFGFGEYGKHWIIQSYDGQKRADNGLWLESETNWVYHFDPNTLNAGTSDQGIMKRGVGYVVALDLDQIKADDLFVGRITTIALYFPSTNTITDHIVNTSKVIIPVPEHVCTINRNTPKGDRRVKDSHWNVIGVPSYINAKGNFDDIDGKFDQIEYEKRPQELQFYYRWLGDYDKYEVTTPSTEVKFNSLTAYMVQYAGDLTWTSVLNEGPAPLAAKRNSDDMKQHHLRLELQQNGTEQDRTFIQLQEDEVTAGFDFNYDLCKINNSGANIYSLIATDRDPIEVAGNVLPVEEAIIPLGIKLDAAGEYTFSMPQGTDNIVVELIDYENNTRTNMLLDDYTVDLGKGTFETRFALHVKPDKTVTGLEEVNTNTNGVKKYLINGILYMQKDGALYDAQGKLVR